MLLLVVDTATPAITAALVEVDRHSSTVRAQRVTVDGRAHGELLAPSIEAVLTGAGAVPADLAAVVAGLGPGPFTGLRVGLVTAVALGQALGIPTYGVCSLDGIGHGTAGRVLVATDARRREVYWAVYADGARLAGPAVDRPDEAAARARALAARVAAGDGAHRYAETLGAAGFDLLDQPRYPRPGALAALAAPRLREGAPGEPLTPLYLRRPDATRPGERKPALR
jgi:tRNA threonylcarbamoyladenosine biosynthesis protein TsaB